MNFGFESETTILYIDFNTVNRSPWYEERRSLVNETEVKYAAKLPDSIKHFISCLK